MYIGVTGFTNREQVHAALSHVPTEIDRKFMVGALASYKTIQGEPAGNPKRYPMREDIADIFPLDWRTVNLLHYNTRDQNALALQLWSALEWAGPNCDGFQLNIVWPDPTVVAGLRRSRPNIVIVLQINRNAMWTFSFNAEKVAAHAVDRYGDLVNYMLVDSSGGAGTPLVPHDAAAYLIELDRARERRHQNFKLLVAGGLCAENLEELITPVRMLVPEIGIDAEGALRTDDFLDDEKVSRYIDTAYRFLTLNS